MGKNTQKVQEPLTDSISLCHLPNLESLGFNQYSLLSVTVIYSPLSFFTPKTFTTYWNVFAWNICFII